MSAFSALKKRTKSNFASAQKKVEEARDDTGNRYEDNRFWQYQADEQGKCQVTLRFLPIWEGADEAKDDPLVATFSHAFKGDGHGKQWYIDDCRSTLTGGKITEGECPVCDFNSEYTTGLGGWKAMTDAQQSKVRSGGDFGRGRRKQFIANIYIVEDKANPENNGKVFLWRFGPFLKKMVDAAIIPEFDDETPIDPFDLWEGANFSLRVRKVEGQTNYAKSSFDKPERLLATDEELEAVWKAEYDLSEFTNPEKFNTVAKQVARFELVESNDKKSTKPSVEEKPQKEQAESKVEEQKSELEGVAEEVDDFFDDLLD